MPGKMSLRDLRDAKTYCRAGCECMNAATESMAPPDALGRYVAWDMKSAVPNGNKVAGGNNDIFVEVAQRLYYVC